jgi:hypothetical protein
VSHVVQLGQGKQKFHLRRSWWERVIALAIIGAVFVVLTTASGLSGNGLLIFWGIVLAVAVSSELLWGVYNYVVIHPERVDVSRWIWGTKAKNRTKHRISYANVTSVTGDEMSGRLHIEFREQNAILKAIGIKQRSVDLVLAAPHDVLQVKTAIELGRHQASQPADADSSTVAPLSPPR